VGVSCDNPKCVHPDHLVARTRSQAISGHTKPRDAVVRMALTKRAQSHVSDQVVREVVLSDLSSAEAAEKSGYCRSMVNKIRSGEFRRDYSSPWAGL
jgi:hypothetical protein